MGTPHIETTTKPMMTMITKTLQLSLKKTATVKATAMKTTAVRTARAMIAQEAQTQMSSTTHTPEV